MNHSKQQVAQGADDRKLINIVDGGREFSGCGRSEKPSTTQRVVHTKIETKNNNFMARELTAYWLTNHDVKTISNEVLKL